MADIAFVGLIVAFFALAVLFVHGCERIIGPGEQAAGGPTRQPAPERELAA